jgi:ketosteroid isomerase-like protein
MSENLDLVRSIYADWERGDFSSAEWADPEIEWVIPDGSSPGRWAGRAGMVEGFGDFLSAWENFSVEAQEYRELDEERVLVLVRQSGRGKVSGLEIGRMRSNGASLFHLRSRKVTRLAIHLDRERALADLGLAPEDGRPEQCPLVPEIVPEYRHIASRSVTLTRERHAENPRKPCRLGRPGGLSPSAL